jgi:anaerobic magnesium-protoporphyrin IX monomethyl ester cyclase
VRILTSEPLHLPALDPQARRQKVLLIGFQDQDNLGLRYLMSAVNTAGHVAEIMTYRSDPQAILERIHHENPDVVGFSLIFQYMAPDFGRVIQALRDAGVTAHFTMGGHYASFEPAEILRRIPGLDSVVRFDGEVTLINILNCLGLKSAGKGTDYRSLPGIAFREDNGVVKVAPLAKVVENLDNIPPPDRRTIDYEGHPMPTASILASRGCPWDCSFCSIRPFYEEQGGPLRRLRSPEAVVEEMLDLHENRSVPIFLFQDDDFLAGGKNAKRWAMEIADLLAQSGHAGKIAWKISCRSDEIEPEILARLMAGGLTHVYMGVESGDEEGLINMSKRIKPDTHLRAGRILKAAGLSFDFGFMLLDPYSTFDSIRNNITFLEDFIGDGWAVAPFCRMLPYAGTPIERRLQTEGRLLGTQFDPDYKFLDPKLDLFYEWMLEAFYERNFTHQGLCHILRGLLFEARLRLPGRNRVTEPQRSWLHYLTAICNRTACYTLRCAVDHIESTPLEDLKRDTSYLDGLIAHEKREESRLIGELAQYYDWVHPDHSAIPGPVGGIDKSWTFNEGDREALGIGAAQRA